MDIPDDFKIRMRELSIEEFYMKLWLPMNNDKPYENLLWKDQKKTIKKACKYSYENRMGDSVLEKYYLYTKAFPKNKLQTTTVTYNPLKENNKLYKYFNAIWESF
tara:strand:+ start:803 stop:1117 length:315 start_codon:yes stop_codon:yes gene_type:complete